MELKLEECEYKSFKISRRRKSFGFLFYPWFETEKPFSDFYGPGKSKSPNN